MIGGQEDGRVHAAPLHRDRIEHAAGNAIDVLELSGVQIFAWRERIERRVETVRPKHERNVRDAEMHYSQCGHLFQRQQCVRLHPLHKLALVSGDDRILQ